MRNIFTGCQAVMLGIIFSMLINLSANSAMAQNIAMQDYPHEPNSISYIAPEYIHKWDFRTVYFNDEDHYFAGPEYRHIFTRQNVTNGHVDVFVKASLGLATGEFNQQDWQNREAGFIGIGAELVRLHWFVGGEFQAYLVEDYRQEFIALRGGIERDIFIDRLAEAFTNSHWKSHFGLEAQYTIDADFARDDWLMMPFWQIQDGTTSLRLTFGDASRLELKRSF